MAFTIQTSRVFFVVILLVLPATCWSFQTDCFSRRNVKRFQTVHYYERRRPTRTGTPRNDEMLALERDVMETTKARLDLKRVNDAFLEDDDDAIGPIDAWKVALAAGLVTSFACNAFLLHSLVLSSIAGVIVFVLANGDPLEEDSVAGALARVVGRFTLKSVQASQPKVRAIARAAVRGDEDVLYLQKRVEELEEQNAELILWKLRRQAVDAKLADYNVEELKAQARANKIAIAGTKSQLLMRLVEAGIITL